MTNRKKLSVLIGSVLKPVDDIRHYQKIGKGIVQGDYPSQVHIYGYPSNKIYNAENVTFYPSKPFKRISLDRIWSKWLFLKLLLKLKPDVTIVCTHELIIPAVIGRILGGSKLIYDVQENYFLNNWYGNTFPIIVAQLLSIALRIKEIICTPFFKQFWLAEAVYAKQLIFLPKSKIRIYENKVSQGLIDYVRNKEVNKSENQNVVNLLMYGTVGSEYGVKRLIELVGALKEVKGKTIKLKIKGRCTQLSYLRELTKLVESHENIDIHVSGDPITFYELIDEVLISDVIVMPYKFTKATAGRVPTKIWESIICGKPIIIQQHPDLQAIVGEKQGVFYTDFHKQQSGKLEDRILESILWEAPSLENRVYTSVFPFDKFDKNMQSLIKF